MIRELTTQLTLTMKHLKTLLLITLALICAGVQAARPPVPLVNYADIAIATSSGNPPSAEQFKQAVVNGGATKNWTVTQQPDGKLVARIEVRGKHSVSVEISFASKSYSLQYKSSDNMQYSDNNGSPIIHPFYNVWVKNLNEAIRIELSKL